MLLVVQTLYLFLYLFLYSFLFLFLSRHEPAQGPESTGIVTFVLNKEFKNLHENNCIIMFQYAIPVYLFTCLSNC